MHPAAHRWRLYSPKSIVALSQRVTLVTVFLVTQRTENLQMLRRFTKCLERGWLANLCSSFAYQMAQVGNVYGPENLKPDKGLGSLRKSSVYRTLRPRKSESQNQRLAEGSGGGFFESCAEDIRAERLSAGRRFSASLPINSELGQCCRSQHAKCGSQSIRHTTECRLR